MAQQKDYGCFAIVHDDGHERVMHAVIGLQPADARAISEEEAADINAKVDALYPPASVPNSALESQLAASVNLKPIFDKIDALSRTVLDQAKALDAAHEKISSQANDILKFKDNTAKAIAQMAEGIGERGA